MNEKQRSFMEQLLEQEPALTNEQYLAYRAKISEGIRKAHNQERTMRIVTKSAWVVTGVVILTGMILDFNRDSFPEIVRLWLIAATMLCLACSTAFLVFYLVNYRPRLKDAEQHVLLLTLQRQLCELRAQLEQTSDRSVPTNREDTAAKE